MGDSGEGLLGLARARTNRRRDSEEDPPDLDWQATARERPMDDGDVEGALSRV